MLFILVLASSLLGIGGLPLPSHCYDLISNSGEDSCGSNDLTYNSKRASCLGDWSGNSLCDISGCHLISSGGFSTPVPPGIGETYTIALWMRKIYDSPIIVFALV